MREKAFNERELRLIIEALNPEEYYRAQMKREIEISLKEIAEGKIMTNEEVQKKIRQYIDELE
ncbi:MAG: hypothetical protein ACK5IQ_05595 [Bacteroidales bacterium]